MQTQKLELSASHQKVFSTPEAPPAVTTPPFLKTGGSFASCSRVVLGFGCSSSFISTSFLLILRVIGVISSANTPASAAAPQVCCDRRAKASHSSLKVKISIHSDESQKNHLVTPNLAARFSAVTPMGVPESISVKEVHIMSSSLGSAPSRVPNL